MLYSKLALGQSAPEIVRDIPSDPTINVLGVDVCFRHVVLVTISLAPLGGHFFKNALSSLETQMLADERLQLTSTGYGMLVASFSFSSLFLPLFGGYYVDSQGHRNGMIFFAMMGCFGQLVCTLSLHAGYYWPALFGSTVFGMAQGNIVTAQRALISRHFAHTKELTFSIGYSVGIACLGKMVARASVVPFGQWWEKIGFVMVHFGLL